MGDQSTSFPNSNQFVTPPPHGMSFMPLHGVPLPHTMAGGMPRPPVLRPIMHPGPPFQQNPPVLGGSDEFLPGVYPAGDPMMHGGPPFIYPPPQIMTQESPYPGSSSFFDVVAARPQPMMGMQLPATSTGMPPLAMSQMINAPAAVASASLDPLGKTVKKKSKKKIAQSDEPGEKKHLRKAAGEVWADPTLDEWPEGDFRVFCGDLGNEVTDEVLANAFRRFSSFQKAKVIRDNRTGKTKGFGFVSFQNPSDMLAALKEMNRQYVGNRPIKVLKSKWKDREIDSTKNKQDANSFKIVPINSKSVKKFKINKSKSKSDATTDAATFSQSLNLTPAASSGFSFGSVPAQSAARHVKSGSSWASRI